MPSRRRIVLRPWHDACNGCHDVRLFPFHVLVGALFISGGAAATGWTMYSPLSLQMGPGMDMAIFAVHLMGASSIMGAINIITTILKLRATPGVAQSL